MSVDLERMFASLSIDSDAAPLPAPGTLRRRGDRRTRGRVVAGLVAVAVLVAGTAIGARQLLAGPGASMPPITDTPSPATTPGSPPATAPSSLPPATTQPPTPTPNRLVTIPNRAFLHKEDTVFGTAVPADYPRGPRAEFGRVGDEYLPQPCSSGEFDSDSAIEARRSAGLYVDHYPATGPYPSQLDQTITRYAGDGARRYLADLRSAIDRCPSIRRNGTIYRHRIVASGFAGDESLLITRTFLTRYIEEQPLYEATYYVAVVRVGDTVTVLYDQGWESAPSPRAELETLADRAALRLNQWRG